MSDILIKNMEIPKDFKYVDVRIFCDGTATTSTAEEPFYKRMDVAEVPPHGDLIDRDALLASENQHYEYRSDSFYVETRTIGLAPTIIGEEYEK